MLNVHDSKQVKKYIPIISREIERLLILLQDFLLVNKNNVELDIMDINMLIEEVTMSFKPMLTEKSIELKMDIIDDEILIDGDYKRLSQVFINILKNSIEAMDKKRGTIIIDQNLMISRNHWSTNEAQERWINSVKKDFEKKFFNN